MLSFANPAQANRFLNVDRLTVIASEAKQSSLAVLLGIGVASIAFFDKGADGPSAGLLRFARNDGCSLALKQLDIKD